jgi:hypothetical protein
MFFKGGGGFKKGGLRGRRRRNRLNLKKIFFKKV